MFNNHSILDLQGIKAAFERYDKKKTGFVQIDYVADIFRYAGQNPSKELEKTLQEESNKQGNTFYNTKKQTSK